MTLNDHDLRDAVDAATRNVEQPSDRHAAAQLAHVMEVADGDDSARFDHRGHGAAFTMYAPHFSSGIGVGLDDDGVPVDVILDWVSDEIWLALEYSTEDREKHAAASTHLTPTEAEALAVGLLELAQERRDAREEENDE